MELHPGRVLPLKGEQPPEARESFPEETELLLTGKGGSTLMEKDPFHRKEEVEEGMTRGIPDEDLRALPMTAVRGGAEVLQGNAAGIIRTFRNPDRAGFVRERKMPR